MRILKNILSNLHRFVLWALLSVLFWSWIFTFLTDTAPAKKVTVFIDAVRLDELALNLRLEEDLPDGIKMVRVHNLDYQMMGGRETGDLYILPASKLARTLAEHPQTVAPIELPPGCEGYDQDGVCCGVCVYDAETGVGCATDKVTYRSGDPVDGAGSSAENYYLCINAASIHYAKNENAIDNAAWQVAMTFLRLVP